MVARELGGPVPRKSRLHSQYLNIRENTLGWRPTCRCDTGEPVGAVVLDPFAGCGTTVLVAEALGRRGIGIDLSAEYLGHARRRIERPHAPVRRARKDEAAYPLFDGL